MTAPRPSLPTAPPAPPRTPAAKAGLFGFGDRLESHARALRAAVF
jgi:hypothetical protein